MKVSFPETIQLIVSPLLFWFYWYKRRGYHTHLLLRCFLGVFKMQDILADSRCRNQYHVSVLQRVVSLRAQ